MSRRRDPFGALADPTRAVSQHLKVLRQAGLVRARKRGREWHYRLDPAPLAEIWREWLEPFAPLWDESLAALKRRVEGAS